MTLPIVLFNASVVLAGLKSPGGGSAKLLAWIKKHKIKGVISQIILDEILRNLIRLDLQRGRVETVLASLLVVPAPLGSNVREFNKIVVDVGDSHVLASALEVKADYLVTLDKKHILILKDRVKKFKVVSPAELIKLLN